MILNKYAYNLKGYDENSRGRVHGYICLVDLCAQIRASSATKVFRFLNYKNLSHSPSGRGAYVLYTHCHGLPLGIFGGQLHKRLSFKKKLGLPTLLQ
jgi:hypothetical protein